MAKNRGPRSGRRSSAGTQKVARASAVVVESQRQTPFFCFHDVDRATRGSYAFSPNEPHALALLNFICQMSRLTWAEIEAQTTGGHRKHHPMPVHSLDDGPKADLARSKLDETFGDEIYRFRLGNKRRLWGFRRDRTFHVVWWDTEHDVYPTDPH